MLQNSLGSCNKGSNRIEWIDIARGIGIILVVYGHVLRGLEDAKLVGPQGMLRASDHAIYIFHMPLFFFLAGLNVERSYRRNSVAFIRNRIANIAYPYLLWSLIQGSVQLAVPSYVNAPRSVNSLIAILWHPIAQFWFLYILLCCHLLVWLFRVNRNLVIVTLCCAVTISPYLHEGIVPMTIRMWPFYAIGVLLSESRIRLPEKRNLTPVLAISASAYVIATYFAMRNSSLVDWWSLGAALSGIATTVLFSRVLETANAKANMSLVFLGQMSMTIYILHVMAIAGTRAILLHAGVKSLEVQVVAGTIVGIILPLLTAKLLTKAKAARLVGLLPIGSLARPLPVFAERVG